MSLAASAIKNKSVTYFASFVVLAAGISAYFSLGQLEDPDFAVKTAKVITAYPGASPEEVELEVTDRIEIALQELKQIDYIESSSQAGRSVITINIKPEYVAKLLPQVWDELRRKIRDVQASLPVGTSTPVIIDDFGDVYGHLLAITGDGFSNAELEYYAKAYKKELSLVEGVARVNLWGVQERVIYLDVKETQLARLGISDATLERTLNQQNMIVDAGSADLRDRRIRIAPTGEFLSPEDIGQLILRPAATDRLQADELKSGSELLRIRDIGTIRPGYQEPPGEIMRHNGIPAIALSLSNIPGVNIVDMGIAIDKRLNELRTTMPVGIEVHRVHWQSKAVDDSVKGFMINFAEAVIIVLVILTIGMGWKLAVIIGTALVATILGSFLLMSLFGIDLQRMSLGALIIALGMMVDNAIVVADGYVVRLKSGMDRVKAATEAGGMPSIPLLGATIVAVMAFYPISASDESAGEYTASLFSVVAISLLVSWLVSVTVTPVQCMDMLKDAGDGADDDPYSKGFYLKFRNFLDKVIRARYLTIGVMVVLLVMSVAGFGQVKKLFFPDSSMTKFMIDYWAPQGTRIEKTSGDLARLEAHLNKDDRIDSIATFVGAGPPRFYLPVTPESPYYSYGQIIVNVKDYRQINDLISELNPWTEEHMPDAQMPIRRFGVGPSNTWKFELRISGPAVADADILRSMAGKVENILHNSPLAGLQQNDWRNRVLTAVPEYSQQRARLAGISRDDIASTTKRAYDGRAIGLYREQDNMIPIVLRNVNEERTQVGAMDLLQVQSPVSTASIPLSQVTDGIKPVWEDPEIWRRDRRRTITVQANPVEGVTLLQLRSSVVDEIEALELPSGYTMEWGGEYEDSTKAQASLVPGMLPAGVIMALIVVTLFNAYKPPLVILLTIPFALIGITSGLLITGAEFGFVAILGALSLVGMMIKNAIVLLDEVDINLEKGKDRYEAIILAAQSRLRPVVLAAATTVLGVIPLLTDVFWIGLAVTVMAGLAFGTLLTMIMVPVFYTTIYKIKAP